MPEGNTAAVKCRPDCRYYSTYTNTCDYTLTMYSMRGCPRDACTKYVLRTAPLTRSRAAALEEELPCTDIGREANLYIPEPSLTPPEDPLCLTAGCGHEVYEGEQLYVWENGDTLCPECLEDKFTEMSLPERAELLGCEHTTVRLGRNGAL